MTPRSPALRVNARLSLPADELHLAFSRSGGPGGQAVNKVETRVTLRFGVDRSRALSPEQRTQIRARLRSRLTSGGEIVIHASRHRERLQNIEDARQRLASLIAEALASHPIRRPTKPTRGAVRKRLDTKRRHSETKLRRRLDE